MHYIGINKLYGSRGLDMKLDLNWITCNIKQAKCVKNKPLH